MIRPEYDDPGHRRPHVLGPVLFLGLLTGLAFYLLITYRPALFGDGGQTTGAAGPADTQRTSLDQSSTPVLLALPSPTVYAVAPLFDLLDLLDDNLRHSLEDYAGQPVVLNFWASWCAPCRQEMPALQQAYSQNGESGLVVLGVNQTWQDSLTEARAFVAELDLTFPNVRDDDGLTSNEEYQIIGLPTTVFITPEGKIARVQIGQMTEEQIVTFTSRLIAGEPLTP